MAKDKDVNAIYKILALYEDINKQDSPVTMENYLSYIDRMYIYWLGTGRAEIYNALKGLYSLGAEAEHKQVKATVFHLITELNRGGI